jgi:hypothetical protein
METAVNKINVMWIEKSTQRCLRIAIHGYLNEENASEATSKWKEELSRNLKSEEKAFVICNCINMTGYAPNARKLWQQTLSELKNQIGCFWIITDNNMFVMAAKTMSLLTKFKIKTAKSESEIYIE